jgi:hypothetical protein
VPVVPRKLAGRLTMPSVWAVWTFVLRLNGGLFQITQRRKKPDWCCPGAPW